MNRTDQRASTTETRRSGTFSTTSAVSGAAAGSAVALALHWSGLDHGDYRLSIGAGVLAAIPVLAGALPRIVWAVVFALFAVLAAALSIPYVVLRMKDPADYFSQALGKFTNGYYAYSASVPWTQDSAQDTAATSRPELHATVRVTVPQPAVQAPAFIPHQPARGPGTTAGQLNVVRQLDGAGPTRVDTPHEGRRGQRGRHVA